MPQPHFSLDTDIGIALVLLGLLVGLGAVLLFSRRYCPHAWLHRYDPVTRRSYLSCRLCNATTPGWSYGQPHDKDAA